MARYRRRLSRDQKFVLSAVAVGLLLAAGHGQGGPAHTTVAASTGSGFSNEQLANSMAASGYGWTGSETTCLDELWTEESAGTWSPTVTDPLSGAYGIPQALPADKMAAAGADWQTNSATQVRWGLEYIASTYGTPCGAWAFERSHTPNWY
jgi:resuscitation-promoting factor RpfB